MNETEFRYKNTAPLFQCVLPIPPPVNMLFPTGRNGRRFKSKRYRAWLADVEHTFKGCALEIERCRIEYDFYPKNKVFGDLDNYFKAVNDFLVSTEIIIDDKHTRVYDIRSRFVKYDKENPRVELRIYP